MQLLIDILKNPLGKVKVEELAFSASEENFSIPDLLALSFHQDEQIGFRAAWVLERIYSKHPHRFLPFAISFLEKLPLQQNLSALRNYVKILAFMTKKDALPEIKEIINNYHTDEIVEVVFAWLIGNEIPVAVKSHCLNILANLIWKHPWVKEELVETMEFLLDKQSIAFFAKVKQIRKQLKMMK